MYRELLRTRRLDERLLALCRQGRIGFFGSALGQEAVAVASALAIEPGDWVFPALREGAVLSFDYWVDAQTSSVNFSLWNRTQKQPLEAELPKMVVGKWTHVSLRLAELGDPAMRLKEGDWAVSLLLQATGSPPRKFYVDNVVLTRPRSLKPRAAETK